MQSAQIAAYHVDRTGWPTGEWDTEPDRIDWEHAGLPCLMLRHPRHGNWCGYAAVAEDHPLYGLGYDDADVDVHGGLSYAAACSGEICHVPRPGQPENVWWFGFDCAHLLDHSPGMFAYETKRFLLDPLRPPDLEAEYQNASYVRREVESLAEQLAAQALQ